eukprot:10752065-Ditylum_brightwellii.AAC.1
MDKTVCCSVVSLDSSWLLRMAQLLKYTVDVDGSLAVVESTTAFCFCCGADHGFDCLALGVDWAVVWSIVIVKVIWEGLEIEVPYKSTFAPGKT